MMTNIANAKKMLFRKFSAANWVKGVFLTFVRRRWLDTSLVNSFFYAICENLPNSAFSCPQYTRAHWLYTVTNGRAAFKYAAATIHRIHVKQIHTPWTPIETTGVFDNLGWRNRKRYPPTMRAVQQLENLKGVSWGSVTCETGTTNRTSPIPVFAELEG